MLVKFTSTETGEMVVMSDLAAKLLKALGKECGARGVIVLDEMAPAIAKLQALVAAHSDKKPDESVEDGEEEVEAPSLGARAWPFIEMLRRTLASGGEAHILWEAPGPFGD